MSAFLAPLLRLLKLFAPGFLGKTWDRWRVCLKAIFGERLTPAELEVYRHHTDRQTQPPGPVSEAWLIVGRRGGKSRVASLVATLIATCRDYTKILAPGESGIVCVIASDRKQARVCLRYIAAALESSDTLRAMIVNKTRESIELSNGITIEVHSRSVASPRGRTFVAVILDEVGHWPSDEDGADPDVEIVAALRPGMSTVPGALLVAISSPHAKRGILYQQFKRYFGAESANVLVWRGESREMNPRLPAAVVDAALEDDPERARSEYLAVFRDDISSFVSREIIEACVVVGRSELPRSLNRPHFAFVDPSGGSSDSMTLAIAHVEGAMVVLDRLVEVKAPFNPDPVTAEFAEIIKAFGLCSVVGDAYGGEWPRSRFAANGVEYRLADKTRSELYLTLLPLLNARRVELLDAKRLVGQLAALERRTGRSGKDSVDHAPGAHDDVANADGPSTSAVPTKAGSY